MSRNRIPIKQATFLCTLAFCLLSLVLAFVLASRFSKLTEERMMVALDARADGISEHIHREIAFIKRTLSRATTFPAISRGVLDPENNLIETSSFLDIIRPNSEMEELSLFDYRTNIIYSTVAAPCQGFSQALSGIYEKTEPDAVFFHFIGGDLLVHVGVPISPGGLVEGALGIGTPFEQILGDMLGQQQESFGVQVVETSTGKNVNYGCWHDDIPVFKSTEYSDNIRLNFKSDRSSIKGIAKKSLRDVFLLMTLPILATGLLTIWLAQRYVGNPLQTLSKQALALAGGSTAEPVPPDSHVNEIQQLSKNFDMMRHEIILRTVQLERSNQELERFAYVAAHDLREPLRTISSYLSLIEDELGEAITSETKEYMDLVKRRADRLKVMLGDLLSMARLKANFDRVPVDLNQVLEGVLNDVAGPISENQAEIHRDTLPTINGHPEMIGQLFQNLISNAIKFRVPERSPIIKIEHCVKDGGDQIQISDNGVGFDAKYAKQIFDMFVRLHGMDSYSGTGIGLSICKRVMDLHGGTIAVDSIPGEGTTFTLNFNHGDTIFSRSPLSRTKDGNQIPKPNR